MKKIILTVLISVLATHSLFAESLPVRLKDISKIVEARENQLMGFGLVVGLRNTGDSKATAFTDVALKNLLQKMGISSGGRDFTTRNTASVIVTATLPPFVKKGQKISVTVSALGDSGSLVGGTLLITPLQGADMNIYAVAQGSIVVGGISERGATTRYMKNETTVGRIPDGAIVEKEVPVTFSDQHNITVVMNETNFITVSRATKAIQDSGFEGARAIDANTIKIPLVDLESTDLVTAIAQLENITFQPDSSSKIVINSRTGTVVIGEMVRVFPVALTHGNISVRISDDTQGGGLFGGGGEDAGANEPLQVNENPSQLIYLNPSATLSSLVNSVNDIGASPKDLISIIQALKESGALVGTIEII